MPLKLPEKNVNNIFDASSVPFSSDKGREKKEHPKITFNAVKPKYKLSDVILDQSVRDEIITIINSKKNYDKVFIDWGLNTVMKQGNNLLVNLYGDSGTGKTMCAHVIANELEKKIICVNYADIESKYVGETSKNLCKLFEQAHSDDNIIFFDEADALLSKRVTEMSSSTDVSVNQTRSVLLTLLNDYKGIVIFATNFISNFDSAFMRRIQFHVKFSLPNEDLRKKLWSMYIPNKMPVDVDIDEISKNYDNVSGSDISNAVLKAALKAANDDAKIVNQKYFEDAIQSVLDSKKANLSNVTITKREVSEEYALQQINKQKESSL
jgi:SpoVK/Ycf46/Vps4 family AAA+-type ATPase